MGLERSYFYEKKRIGGRVVSRYIGGGLIGTMRQIEADQVQAARLDLAAQRRHGQQIDQLTRSAIGTATAVIADVLRTAGYHQHKHQWRKQRVNDTTAMTTTTGEMSRAEVDQLMRRCNRPSASAADVAELKRVLRDYPERWKTATNALGRAREQIIDQMQVAPMVRELLRAGADRVRADLGYADAPALERLLIDAVCLCYVRLTLTEQRYTVATAESISLEAAAYWDRHLSLAHSRYVRSVEALARVRRLAVPALIQNIAASQTVQIGV